MIFTTNDKGPLERIIQADVIRCLKALKADVVKIQSTNKSGEPDLLVTFINGATVRIETKTQNGKLRKNQKVRIEELTNRHQTVIVIGKVITIYRAWKMFDYLAEIFPEHYTVYCLGNETPMAEVKNVSCKELFLMMGVQT
jgi:hypothetical protein